MAEGDEDRLVPIAGKEKPSHYREGYRETRPCEEAGST